MSGIPELTLSSWNQFSTVASDLLVGDLVTGYAYVFRGHEDASWRLSPSLHRALTNEGRTALPDAAEALRVENYLLDQFRAMAPNHLPAATLTATRAVADWWPIMRHYGVPTRLLDWTASLYVATYFAVSRRFDTDGVVYLIHAHTLNQAMKATYGSLAELPTGDEDLRRADAPTTVHIFGRKTALPDRIIAQQGCFMICRNVVGDVEAVLGQEIPKVADSGRETLRRLRIPASLKATFLRNLRAMNVTASSLFPGLDGIGRYLEESIRCR
ncbi:FRG domain-containing protein [bacterium]|nr:FRG domain-containing protein [bacterium]